MPWYRRLAEAFNHTAICWGLLAFYLLHFAVLGGGSILPSSPEHPYAAELSPRQILKKGDYLWWLGNLPPYYDGSHGPSSVMRADGAGEAQRLTESEGLQHPCSFSPDGKRLAFQKVSPETDMDLWTLPLDLGDPDRPKPGKPELFLRTSAVEWRAAFSPNGRWMAYVSGKIGAYEVHVQPFPGPGGKWQIPNDGGIDPVWSRNGRQLFYRTLDNRIMVVTYEAMGNSFVADKPGQWSEKRFTEGFHNFDLAPDGRRFAVLVPPEGTVGQKASTQLTVLLNFFDELRCRVPSPQ